MSISVRFSLEQYQGNDNFVLTPATRINYLNKEMAITRLQMMCMIPKVSPLYNTSTFVFVTGAGVASKVTLSPGYYRASDINQALSGSFGSGGSYTVSQQTGLATLLLVPDTSGKAPQIIISPAVGILLGLPVGTYPPTALSSSNYQLSGSSPPQNPVSYVQVDTQMTNSSPINFCPRSIACFLLNQRAGLSEEFSTAGAPSASIVNQTGGMTNTLYSHGQK